MQSYTWYIQITATSVHHYLINEFLSKKLIFLRHFFTILIQSFFLSVSNSRVRETHFENVFSICICRSSRPVLICKKCENFGTVARSLQGQFQVFLFEILCNVHLIEITKTQDRWNWRAGEKTSVIWQSNG